LSRDPIKPEQLLAEIEDALRTMPPQNELWKQTPENNAWLGRASACIEQWNYSKFPVVADALRKIGFLGPDGGHRTLAILLNQAQNEMRMRTIGR
jgi:hypothetical protein